MSRTVSLFISDPGPYQRQGSPTIGDSHYQQLMAIGHFSRIDNQLDRSSRSYGLCQQVFGNGPVPLSHPNVTIVEKTGNTAGTTPALCPPNNLAGNVTQMHRPTVINTRHEPSKIPESRYVLHGKDLSNLLMKDMICLDDGHFCLLFCLVLLLFNITGFVAIVPFLKNVG
jgi:hypothetical protein